MSESPLYIDNVGLMLARHTSLLGHWGNIGSMWVRERGDVFVYIILINDVKFFKFSEEGHCCPPCPPCQKARGAAAPLAPMVPASLIKLLKVLKYVYTTLFS